MMSKIRSSKDVCNNYNEISSFFHDYNEPVFITKNGKEDLAGMCIKTYENMKGRFELYSCIYEGMQDVENGRTRPVSEAFADLRKKKMNWNIKLKNSEDLCFRIFQIQLMICCADEIYRNDES